MRPLLALVTLVACAGEVPRPYRAEVVSFDHAAGGYVLRVETLETLADLDSLAGGAARVRVAADIPIGLGARPRTEEEWRAAFAVRGDEPPRLLYVVENGTVIAEDWDTLALLSVYRGLERARAFFDGLGLAPGTLPVLPVYYNVDITLLGVLPLLTDNAAYTPLAGDAGALLLFEKFLLPQDVPLALNLGVLTHEMAHAVFHFSVWGRRLPPTVVDGWPAASTNQLRSLDEGLADFFGAAHTGDTRFVGRSVPELSGERDLAVARTFDAAALPSPDEDVLSYDPYPLGSVWASALWEAGERIGRARVGALVIELERVLAGILSPSFTTEVALSALVSVAAPGDERAQVCAVLAARFTASFPGCP